MNREQSIIETEQLLKSLLASGVIESDKPLTPKAIRELAVAAQEGAWLDVNDFLADGLVV